MGTSNRYSWVIAIFKCGHLTIPEFANFRARGDWVLEGTGISSVTEVDNHTAKVMEGIDQHLNIAIEEV